MNPLGFSILSQGSALSGIVWRLVGQTAASSPGFAQEQLASAAISPRLWSWGHSSQHTLIGVWGGDLHFDAEFSVQIERATAIADEPQLIRFRSRAFDEAQREPAAAALLQGPTLSADP